MPVTKDDTLILCNRVGAEKPYHETIIKPCAHCGNPVYICATAWPEACRQTDNKVKPVCDVCLPDIMPDGYGVQMGIPGPATRAAFEKATGKPLTNELAIELTSGIVGIAKKEKMRRRGERN